MFQDRKTLENVRRLISCEHFQISSLLERLFKKIKPQNKVCIMIFRSNGFLKTLSSMKGKCIISVLACETNQKEKENYVILYSPVLFQTC